jgi:hypothetical protein
MIDEIMLILNGFRKISLASAILKKEIRNSTKPARNRKRNNIVRNMQIFARSEMSPNLLAEKLYATVKRYDEISMPIVNALTMPWLFRIFARFMMGYENQDIKIFCFLEYKKGQAGNRPPFVICSAVADKCASI